MKTIFGSLLSLFALLSSCTQEPSSPEDWLTENTVELASNNYNYDFSELGKAIGNKRIVAIGESTHGLGSYYKLKSELVAFLHQELDYKVLAMEGGLGDIYLAYHNIDNLSYTQLRDHTVFGNFRATEANQLFTYMKKAKEGGNPLYYTGYDTQASSNYLFTKIGLYISEYNQQLADSLDVRMRSYQKSFAAGRNGDSLNYVKHRDVFRNTSMQALSILEKNKGEIIEKHQLKQLEYEVITRSLTMFERSVNLSFNDRFMGLGLRDELMFENLKWLLDKVYPNQKFIVWAHNAHIEKYGVQGSPYKWMGHFLNETYGNDYYSIGLFAYKGDVYQYWTNQTTAFENKDPDHVEKKLFDTGKKVGFLNLQDISETTNTNWLFELAKAFEPENNGIVSFVPHERFDAIINVAEATPPTYE